MTNRLQGWWAEVSRAALVALLEFIFGLIFTAVTFALLAKVLVLKSSFFAPFKWYLAIIFTCGGGWLFVYLFNKFSRHRPRFPRLNVDFHIIEKDISYERDSADQIVYKKRVVLRALREGLDCYQDKYHWTGSAAVAMKSSINDQEVKNTFRKTVWQYYEIRFPKFLAKDETIETEIVWQLNDSDHTSVPFVSAAIEEPTSVLRLSLELPPSLGVSEVICETTSGLGARRPFESHRLHLNREGRVTWPIENPKLLYFYEMKWIPASEKASA